MIPKFRAWLDPDMYDEPVIHNGKFYLDWRDYEDGATYDLAVLMQSTGLKDKNGVEVFEGDIVIAWSQGVKGIFEIKRRIDGLWLLYPAWKDGQFWYLSPTEDGRETIEVIGNIYENPKLLESVEE
ncbi:YopX family protein [Streptococcus dysgalactiae]|uniref:YopX family protein n=1 Tax=Streptococcus dysgalactiae TaxID=1334 RepID=UPI00232DAA79|nr:YopX family protein [Streptococcus dysgalactiae]WCE85971.1 YopX family protein [Streptococcus dysgalactiae]WCN25967.1 YopX family protein [Streptococcus dysgalactiae]